VWGNKVRVGLGPLLQGAMKCPPTPPYIQPLGRRLDFEFGLDEKSAIASTSRTSFVFNDQTKASPNPTFVNKVFARRKQTLMVKLIVLRRGQ
jgi:hypothetical protein